MKYFLYLLSFALLTASCDKPKEKLKESEVVASIPVDSTYDTAHSSYTVNTDACEHGIYIKHAYAYNNFITNHQAYIIEKNMDFVEGLKKYESVEKSRELYKELIEQTDKSIDSLQKLCPFNGNTDFKDAGIELFKFYKKAWAEYSVLVDETNKEEWIKNYKKISLKFNETHSKEEKNLEDKFYTAHTKFSDEYMLHISKTTLHERFDSMLYAH
jgi:hypothetical protein